jgi:hypothetical protein
MKFYNKHEVDIIYCIAIITGLIAGWSLAGFYFNWGF